MTKLCFKLIFAMFLLMHSVNSFAEPEPIVITEQQKQEELRKVFNRKMEKKAIFSKLPSTIFGVTANNQQVLELAKFNPLPDSLPSNSSSLITFNQMGVDIVTAGKEDNWLIREFLEYTKSTTRPIIDIGAGLGGISLKALEQGATVIANDLDLENLLFLVKNIHNPLLLNRLSLNTNYFPEQTEFPEHMLGGVLAYRVLQFLTGKQIEQGVKKMESWVSTGDKIFLAVICPQNHVTVETILPMYNQAWSNGNPWPGENIPTEQVSSTASVIGSKYMNIMDERPLKQVFEKYGFQVEKSGFIARDYNKNGRTFTDEKALFGMILVKD